MQSFYTWRHEERFQARGIEHYLRTKRALKNQLQFKINNT